MKKIIISVFVLAFVFAVGFQSAEALTYSAANNLIPGCASTTGYSYLTGMPCYSTLGDVNNDSLFTCADYQMIMKASSGQITLTSIQKIRADMNSNGIVNSTDALLFLQRFNLSCSTVGVPVISGVSGPQTLNVGQQGTWTVTASDPSGEYLSYSVDWGDSSVVPVNGGGYSQTQLQNATFTHVYNTVGNYNPTFTVTNQSGQSAHTSLGVNVGGTISPSITVISPNGGETWTKGTTQIIKWQDSVISPSMAPTVPTQYDIHLYTYCPEGNCPPLVRVIKGNFAGSGSSQNSYVWNVGQTSDGTGIVPDGSYTLQICRSGSEIPNCDKSNSYFKIISQNSGTPIIHSVSGPQTLNVGQQGTWKVTASNLSGGNLSYSVIWGDEPGVPVSTSMPSVINPSQTATFTHTYNTAGNYTPIFFVMNQNNQVAQRSLSVNVGNVILNQSLLVSSPEKGSKWNQGKAYTIKWNAPLSKTSPDFTPTVKITIARPIPSCLNTIPPLCASVSTMPIIVEPYVIAQDAPNTGSYTWTIPNYPTTADVANPFNNFGDQQITVVFNGKEKSGVSDIFSVIKNGGILPSPLTCGVFTRTLKKGVNNSEVKCLQQMLNAKGFKVQDVGYETTYFGEATATALKNFQAQKGLTADGIFGAKTRGILVEQ